ncbi:efflux RND transporter permease subunit [Salinarimonas ramus]|uniref:Multidrug transporter n=1 Tax=Salinarimonas ramus TaxID=690164 RepID=A0A917V2K8_9HYPH|nr:efflux RND transporter permease subunit [Salinarimonas ramus]GGK23384.1 multidrug transporter [Salinarimonas ramus]
MTLPGLSVRRPVLAATLALLVVVLGVSALLRMPVREYPNIERPVVSVTTAYPGAAPEIVERDVTRIVEDALSGVTGIELIQSTSTAGSSTVDVTFVLDRDIDAAASDVRENVSAVRNDLPDRVEAPVVAKAAADAQAMMWLTLTSDARDTLALTDLAERRLRDPLSVVPGVSRVIVGGAQRYAMRVRLDVARMAARDVTAADVTRALRTENVEVPAGRLVGEAREFTVRTDTRLRARTDFADLVLREGGAGAARVTLGDVADIEIGPQDRRSAVFSDGEPAVGLGIVRATGGNTIDVADRVLAEVDRLRESLPEDVTITTSYSQAVFVRQSVEEVISTLGITALLVVAVIFLFLGSAKGTLVPAVTIPVSLVGTFAVLSAFGFSINVLTLLALVLAVGLVVDDAIVVLENVTRRRENGEPKLAAAVNGASEVFLPVVATTLVLLAVLAPIATLTGTIGRLFTEFAVALMAAIVISSALALTAGAAIASSVAEPRRSTQETRGWRRAVRKPLDWFAAGLEGLERGYAHVAGFVVRHAWIALAACLVLGASGWAMLQSLPSTLAPDEDRGFVIVPVTTAPGSTIEETIGALDAVRAVVMRHAGEDGPVDGTTTLVGVGGGGSSDVTSGLMIVRLKPWGERETTQMAFVEEVRGAIASLPQAQAIAINPSGLVPQGFGKPVQIVLLGPDYETTEGWARDLVSWARAEAPVQALELDFDRATPQVEVDIDRALAAELGLDVAEIGEALRVVLGGDDVTDWVYDGETYEVIVRAAPDDRAAPGDLGRVQVRAENGTLVPLSIVAETRVIGAPDAYRRVNRRPAMVISAVPDGASLGAVIERFETRAAEIVPERGDTTTLGLSREFAKSTSGIWSVFALALVVVFLTLAALFESVAFPVVILLAVPLAIAGGLLALLLAGLSFNIYSQIALLLLVGLLAKNAILVVDFANSRRAEGAGVRDAALEAARTRFRPVLMTSIATAFGAVPLALATGAGAEARGTIGIVILVGIAVATAITLLVVPGLYVLLGRIAKVPGRRQKRVAEELQQVAGS